LTGNLGQPSDCLFCQACEGWFGCGKGVDGSTWETRLRFPLSPNAAAAGFFKKAKQQQVAPL